MRYVVGMKPDQLAGFQNFVERIIVKRSGKQPVFFACYLNPHSFGFSFTVFFDHKMQLYQIAGF